MRLARKIAQQPALKPYVAEEMLPGAGVASDDAVRERRSGRDGISNLHPVGTCRMGRDATRWSTRGCGSTASPGLRVVDASVMPQVPAGNTNAPSIMIGEKCAAMILEDARAA